MVDASFIQLQNVALSWVVPAKLVSRIGADQATAYVRAQNLFTISSYEGYPDDPGSLGLPPLRFITSGIRLTF